MYFNLLCFHLERLLHCDMETKGSRKRLKNYSANSCHIKEWPETRYEPRDSDCSGDQQVL